MFVLNPRQGLKALLCLTGAILVTACVTTSPALQQPVKSPNDDYQYRLLTLPNKMEVLLISDPSTAKAAASLDIAVGSGDNPPGRGGLAHGPAGVAALADTPDAEGDIKPDAKQNEEKDAPHQTRPRITSSTKRLPT